MRIIEQLVYKILGDSTDFNREIDNTSKKFSTFGNKVKKVMAGLGITVSLKKVIDVTKQAVEDFAAFESGLAKVSTLFGDVNVNMDTLSKGVLKVSSNTGLLSDEINEALYSALSAGVEVTEDMSSALELVESSSKLARAGFTDTDTALSATIKTINAYKLGLDDTDRIQRILIQTQNKGITTVGELGQNLAKVTPTAAAFGYSFENVGAAIATMTAQGMRTEISTTYLAQIMTELGKAGTTASEGLKNAAESAGLAETDAKSLTESGMSLGDILDLMGTYAKNSGKSLVDMFGSVEAGKGALALTGSNLETFNSNLESMSTNADLVGEGFATMTETVEGQTRILKANIESISINMGKKLLPAANSVIGAMVTFTDKLLKQKTATGEMAGVLNTITTKTADYKSISDQLVNTQNNLSDAERNLLLARKETLAFEIQKQLVSLASSYNETKDNIVTLENEVTNLNKLFDNQNAYLKTLPVGTLEYNNAQAILEYTYSELVGKQQELSSAQISYNGLISEASKLVADGVLDIEKLADVNSELYNKIIKGAEAYKIKKQAETDAIKSLGDLSKASEGEIRALIAETQMMLQGSQSAYDKAYYTKQLEIATKALTGATEDNVDALEEQTNAINEMARTRMSDHEKALAEINEQAAAWIQAGVDETEVAKWVSEQKQKLEEEETKKLEEEEEARKKARENAYAEIERSRMNEYQSAVDNIEQQTQAYIDSGVSIVDAEAWKAEQIQKLDDEETKKLEQEEANRKKIREDAYAEIERSRMDEYQLALDNIEKQADAYLEADVSIVEVEKWKNEELARLQEEQTAKAEEEAEKQRKAWEDATFSMLGSVTSIWSSINQVQANANDEEIQRIEEQNAIAIQAAKDRGASEEEITALEESLQADLNDAKNKYAQEEAERNKALSTLSVILDTAKAIMQIWANPLIAPWGKGLWTGLAAGAGAAQIAAINSAPVPSYDVGSIRIPETTTATVHKDEMILTAPQAEQARREGITIAPTTKASGNSVNLVIYLDGKEIARNTIDNLNSGSVGTIKARVVK